MKPPGGLPRWFDALAASLALLVLSPILLVVGLAIRLTSRGPALFRQERIGLHGMPFELLKFRSMTSRASDPNRPADTASQVTATGDHRITSLGRLLRKTKLDELPELFNVARGQMALVGPRPEVRQYVDLASPAWQNLLSVRPGLTDETTLLLRNEEQIIELGAKQAGTTPETFYREHLLPFKLRFGSQALCRRSSWKDVRTLTSTLFAILVPARNVTEVLAQILDTP